MSRTRSGRKKRSYAPWVIPGLVVVTAVVGYYIFTQAGTAGGSSLLDGTPASPAVLNDLAGVSGGTLTQVGYGATGIASPTTIAGPALTLNGKPEVLYMGAEYCPYCGAERWAMIVALDRFGNFTGIQYMQSSSTDVYPNTPTFSFVSATYTSKYIAFVTVEQEDRNEQPLQAATSPETAVMDQFDSGQTIPFVDFANQYTITSSQYLPSVLRAGESASGAPYNWTQIAPQLNNASSPFAMNIDGAANRLISAICKIDGDTPTTVCSNSYADTLSYYKMSTGGSQLLATDALMSGQAPPVTMARFAPVRLTDRA